MSGLALCTVITRDIWCHDFWLLTIHCNAIVHIHCLIPYILISTYGSSLTKIVISIYGSPSTKNNVVIKNFSKKMSKAFHTSKCCTWPPKIQHWWQFIPTAHARLQGMSKIWIRCKQCLARGRKSWCKLLHSNSAWLGQKWTSSHLVIHQSLCLWREKSK